MRSMTQGAPFCWAVREGCSEEAPLNSDLIVQRHSAARVLRAEGIATAELLSGNDSKKKYWFLTFLSFTSHFVG